MSAKALFVAKLNSHPFEDRVLLLDIPVKIGRSHRDDQVIKEQKTFRREQKNYKFCWYLNVKYYQRY